MVTIKDVAEVAQVSISTVSRVLNGTAKVAPGKKEAVMKAVADLGYQPSTVARALVGHRTGMIGLLVGCLADPFFGTLMQGVERQACAYGLQVIAAEGHHDAQREEASLRSLIARRCDALIIHALQLTDQQINDIIGDLPVVVVNRQVAGMEDRCLWFDNFEAGYLAAKHLLSCGHTRLGWIGRDQDIEDNHDRFAGFCRAIREHGIARSSIAIKEAPGTAAGGYKVAKALFEEHPDLTAVLAYNDATAAGCLRALHERGCPLPQTCSVMGVDDVYLAEYLHPPLTTIHYPIETIGQTAVKMVNSFFTDEPLDIGHCFKPHLVERGSVAQLS
ncbi:LacI family DNA-binding transcriptional regulator [Parendozoicomonas haliclonae]|uniref:HTH-type transcriptional regulator GalR n=1 Tax=Parendozoicomonas haliclonae TaxID=1960125 RepID=A0A1X7ALS5_9GAMM|nr:LacI family DNA-binding transcriptional regulator [Parendozoicomonas haliclonae]SMA48732.1 HTH-type transcriptional regulator GalR [Parendozoicomonas haliclonae]